MSAKIDSIKLTGIEVTIHAPKLRSSHAKPTKCQLKRFGNTNFYDIYVEYVETIAREHSYKIKVTLKAKFSEKLDLEDDNVIQSISNKLLLADVSQPITETSYNPSQLGKLVYGALATIKNNEEINIK